MTPNDDNAIAICTAGATATSRATPWLLSHASLLGIEWMRLLVSWRRLGWISPPVTLWRAPPFLLIGASPANTVRTSLAGALGLTRMGWLLLNRWLSSEPGTHRREGTWSPWSLNRVGDLRTKLSLPSGAMGVGLTMLSCVYSGYLRTFLHQDRK